MTAHKTQSSGIGLESVRDNRSKPDVIVIIATFLMFASIYFIPKPLHNGIFYLSLAGLAIFLWPRVLFFVRSNPLFLGVIALFLVATITSGYLRGITLSVLGRNLSSVITIPLFCFVAMAVWERIGWQMLRLLLLSALIAAAIAFGAFILEYGSAAITTRFDAPGTGRNAIQFAGLMMGGIIVAAIEAFDMSNTSRFRLGNAVGALFLVLLCFLSGSRGPIIGMVFIALIALIFYRGGRSISGVQLAALAVLAWALVTGVVLSSIFLEKVYCPLPAQFCRPAERVDIWSWVLDQVILHPLLGNGADFRFIVEGKWHAHNAIFGLFMAFGIPAALIWLASILRLIATSSPVARGRKCGIFASLMLIYGFAYMGSDLPHPFSYVGAHYIFLWLPFALLIPLNIKRDS